MFQNEYIVIEVNVYSDCYRRKYETEFVGYINRAVIGEPGRGWFRASSNKTDVWRVVRETNERYLRLAKSQNELHGE